MRAVRNSEGALPEAERDDIDLDDAALLAQAVPPVESMEAGEQTRPEDAERLGDVDALGAYLREAGRFSLLTAEQEVELAKRIEAGQRAHKRLLKKNGLSAPKRRERERLQRDGEKARHEMIQANLRLVVAMARRYRWTGVPLLDLIQDGNIGLMSGVDRYNWRKGFKFATYATWWVRQAIQRGVADRGRVIRLPVHVHDLLARVGRTRIELERQLGREATNEEVARSASLSVARVQELRGFAAFVLSLETPVGDYGDATLGESVPDEAADLRYEEVLSRIGRDEAIKVLATLTKREGTILALHFGLTGEDPLTLEEVGDRFGLTRERIRQVEAKALAKLRHPSRSAALRTETHEAGRAT